MMEPTISEPDVATRRLPGQPRISVRIDGTSSVEPTVAPERRQRVSTAGASSTSAARIVKLWPPISATAPLNFRPKRLRLANVVARVNMVRVHAPLEPVPGAKFAVVGLALEAGNRVRG